MSAIATHLPESSLSAFLPIVAVQRPDGRKTKSLSRLCDKRVISDGIVPIVVKRGRQPLSATIVCYPTGHGARNLPGRSRPKSVIAWRIGRCRKQTFRTGVLTLLAAEKCVGLRQLHNRPRLLKNSASRQCGHLARNMIACRSPILHKRLRRSARYKKNIARTSASSAPELLFQQPRPVLTPSRITVSARTVLRVRPNGLQIAIRVC